jgi:hypothetical protein
MERLENREVLSWTLSEGVLHYEGSDGAEGGDVVAVVDYQGQIVAVEIMRDGRFVSQGGVFARDGVEAVRLDLRGGSDAVSVHNLGKPLLVDLGSGNDSLQVVDGAHGPTPVVAVGGDGDDRMTTGDADDLLIAGRGDVDALARAWLADAPRWQRTVDVRKLMERVAAVGDESIDVLEGGRGFNALSSDGAWEYTFDQWNAGAVHRVAAEDELRTALAQLRPGDRLEIAPGRYQVGFDLFGDFSGVTIVGTGDSAADVVLTGIRWGVDAYDAPFVLRNLAYDATGMSTIPSLGPTMTRFGGQVVLDRIEAFGRTAQPANLIYFETTQSRPTEALILHSYFHDASRDVVSTRGNGQPYDVTRLSSLTVLETTARRSGAQWDDQVLTAHGGFRLIAIGGYFADAAHHVVAPDRMTRIDLYWTTVAAEARTSGVSILTASERYGCTFLNVTTMRVFGRMENCVISTAMLRSGRCIYAEAGALLIGNRLEYANPGGGTTGVVVSGPGVAIVDCVFVGWGGKEIDENGFDPLIEGCLFL